MGSLKFLEVSVPDTIPAWRLSVRLTLPDGEANCDSWVEVSTGNWSASLSNASSQYGYSDSYRHFGGHSRCPGIDAGCFYRQTYDDGERDTYGKSPTDLKERAKNRNAHFGTNSISSGQGEGGH